MIPQFILANAYWLIFVGLLFGGETVLLPAIYLGIEEELNLSLIILISLAATAISDTFWYGLGWLVPIEKISSSHFLASYEKRVFELSKAFEKNGLVILFLSKFVYGTRTAAQILCGVHRIRFIRYFFVNLAGILALNAFFIIVGILTKDALGSFVKSPLKLWGSLALFVAATVTLQVLFKKFVWNKKFQ